MGFFWQCQIPIGTRIETGLEALVIRYLGVFLHRPPSKTSLNTLTQLKFRR